MAQVFITTCTIGQHFGTAGQVLVDGERVHVTDVFPLGFGAPAIAAARQWALDNVPAYRVGARNRSEQRLSRAERRLQSLSPAPRIVRGSKFAEQDAHGLLVPGSVYKDLPAWWLDQAQAYRRAVIAVSTAREKLASLS